jgi:hypothetical protein
MSSVKTGFGSAVRIAGLETSTAARTAKSGKTCGLPLVTIAVLSVTSPARLIFRKTPATNNLQPLRGCFLIQPLTRLPS